ncbi:hypothetical protein NDU88_010999, partial [Pleurodeles waltl]
GNSGAVAFSVVQSSNWNTEGTVELWHSREQWSRGILGVTIILLDYRGNSGA